MTVNGTDGIFFPMWIDISPLKNNRNFRLLYIGQLVSFLGSMVSFVAIPYQVYEITQSTFTVGLLGVAQVAPVVLFGLFGGAYADAIDRRKLLIYSELAMSLAALGLAVNAMFPNPSVPIIFLLTAFMQSANGFHRPAMDALTQSIVDKKEFTAVTALGSFRYSVCAILGPSLGGIMIATWGARFAYIFDFFSFGIAVLSVYYLSLPKSLPKEQTKTLDSIKAGIAYARSRPELIGTYIVDIVAMLFAFPTALFPAMAQPWGGAKAAGILFSAMAAGSLFVTIFSGWANRIKRHGAAVCIAAFIWGVAIVFSGLTTSLWATFAMLAIAGGADMVSGLYRGTIWNETIPNTMRGRLAGIEMISYMTGPLIGNTRAGWMASAFSIETSLVGGGILCCIGVFLCAILLPQFWKYRSNV
jgi:MFS family permease